MALPPFPRGREAEIRCTVAPVHRDEELLEYFRTGSENLVAAIGRYRETDNRGHLAAVATVAFSFLELCEDAPAPVGAELAGVAAAWFRVAATAWGRPELLELAIDLARASTGPDEQPGRALAARLTTLGQSLHDAWEYGAPPDRLQEALDVLARAVAVADPEDPDRPEMQTVLGSVMCQAEDLGLPVDLTEALGLLQAAVDGTPDGDPAVVGRLNNLSNALRRRAERTGQQAYLDLAIEQYELALESVQDDRASEAALHNGLASALHDRYTLGRGTATLAQALRHQRSAIELTESPRHIEYWPRRGNLGGYLVEWFIAEQDGSALDEGVELLEGALEHAPAAPHPERAHRAHNLANALHTRAIARRHLDDLERAVALRRHLLEELAPGSPKVGAACRALARALLRMDEMREAGHVDEARDLLRRALDADEVSDPVGAVDAARGLLELSADDARIAAPLGVRALALARGGALTQVGLSARRQLLSLLRGIPARTAAAQLAIGDPRGAALALEAGRAVLFGQQIALAEQAEELPETVAEQLAPLQRMLAGGTPQSPQQRLEARLALHELVDEDKLTRAPDWAQVTAAAGIRPLLYLAAAPQGGVAVLVDDEGRATSVGAPDLAENSVREVLLDYLRVISSLHDPGEDFDDLDRRLGDVVTRLQELVGDEVLSTVMSADELTLVASDDLAGLPLHLLGARRDDAGWRVEGAALATTPSAQTLNYCGRESHDRPITPHLVCAVTSGPRAAPAADIELRAASRLATQPDLDRHATRSSLSRAIEVAGYLQLACHGRSDPWRPYSSVLSLSDGDLAAADLLGHASGRGRLALLTACESAATELELPDESAGLPSAMLALGFGAVVGAVWPISGLLAAWMSDTFNRLLLEGHAPLRAYRATLSRTAALDADGLNGWALEHGHQPELGEDALRSQSASPVSLTSRQQRVPLLAFGAMRFHGW